MKISSNTGAAGDRQIRRCFRRSNLRRAIPWLGDRSAGKQTVT